MWFRKLVRRYTRPISEDKATFWKKRLTTIYVFMAWNAFGLVLYQIYNGKGDWAKFHGLPVASGSPAQQWAHTLGIKKATVYRISGRDVDQFEIDTREDKKDA